MQRDKTQSTSIDSDGNLINNNSAEITQTDIEKDCLKGPVHKVMVRHYNSFMKDGKIYISNPFKDYIADNNTMKVYDEKGTKLYEDSTGSKHKYRRFFDETGLEIADDAFDNEHNLVSRSTREYNDKGLLYEIINYDAFSIMQTRQTRLYNENGNLIIYTEFDKDNQITGITKFTFDTGNNWKECNEQRRTNAAGETIYWSKQKLNNKGNCIERTELEPDGTIKKVTNNEEFFDSDGEYLSKKYANQYEKEIYTSNKQEDHHGNWIHDTLFYKGIAVKIIIRDILYFNEPYPKDIFNNDVIFDVLTKIIKDTDENKMEDTDEDIEEEIFNTDLDKEDAKWLTDRTPTVDQFSISSYYTIKNQEFPSQLYYSLGNIDALQLLKELTTSMNAQNIQDTKGRYSSWYAFTNKYTLVFPSHPGYMVHASNIHTRSSEEYHIPAFMEEDYERNSDVVYLSAISLLHPNDTTDNRDAEFEAEIKSYIKKCTLEVIPEKPEIYMVEEEQKNFSLKAHPIKDDFEISDLDISYGTGFSKFHQELMNRFRRENKGLVLFHGLPGTGKTFYIRHLLREMALSNKRVIYMPPNMVDHLVEPAFMTFLTQTVNGYSAEGFFCVLLIEDAEPLLITRETENRIQGITNLLNMTDGILNDMLKLQIICTFNVELKQLDPALLRPGRLIARKEFKALPELDANILAKRLGINFRFRKPATLSEIYAKLKDKNTIIHEDY